MKNKSKNAEEFPSADLADTLFKADHAFARAEAGYFALRGFAADIEFPEMLPSERHRQLNVIVELLEHRHKQLGKYLSDALKLARIEGE